MDNPNANITITFAAETVDGAGTLLLEVQAEDNNGKTRFDFGDSPKFRMYKSSDVTVVKKLTSDGSISVTGGSGIKTVAENVTFSGSRTASVSYPISGGISVEKIAGNIGSISVAGATTLQCSHSDDDPLDPPVGVARVTYQSAYQMHQLSGVSEPANFGNDGFDAYPVVVFFVGTTEEDE